MEISSQPPAQMMQTDLPAADSPNSPDATELYPIGTVAGLTGVKPITLRAWERRYALISPQRTSSGHRRYSRDDIDRINRVLALLGRGMRIGQVKAELDAEGRRRQAVTASDDDAWAQLRGRMTAAIIRFDEDALDACYSEALSLFSVDAVTDSLLGPLLVMLGERWQTGTGSVAEEHFFGFYLRNKLGARFHHRVRNTRGQRLLAACLPFEQHENGLLLLALALHERGYQMVVLGANMPLEELPAAARQARCDAVVLSGSMQPEPELLTLRLPRVVADAHVPIIVGGAASVRCHDAIQWAGAAPVGEDLTQGIRRIDQLLERSRSPAEASRRGGERLDTCK
jgi:DNA-binding transcriptional MerR regulator/methylmalonyl-CoA mutase cobalamin-binding subunit